MNTQRPTIGSHRSIDAQQAAARILNRKTEDTDGAADMPSRRSWRKRRFRRYASAI